MTKMLKPTKSTKIKKKKQKQKPRTIKKKIQSKKRKKKTKAKTIKAKQKKKKLISKKKFIKSISSQPKAMVINCPQCHKKAVFSETTYFIEKFGDYIFTSIKCKSCSFKLNDVMSLRFKEPIAFQTRVTTVKDLETKVIRGSSATLEIPELGVKIEPGPMAEGFITNVEGVLDRVETVMRTILRSEQKNLQAKKVMNLLKKARKGKKHFTLKIFGPFGNSLLLGEKVKKLRLSKTLLESLKKNIYLIEK